MINIIAFDESDVLEGAIEAYEKETGESLYAGDERIFLINSFMYIAKILAGKANYTANQYFEQFAEEEYLTYKGEAKGVHRLPAAYALVTVRFTISSASGNDITIPTGTKVTADGVIFFATLSETVIRVEDSYADIVCQATVKGKVGTYASGSIVTLVDNVNYVISVSNIEESTAGSNMEELKDYRERILLKPNNYNTCGSIEAYKYLAKEANVAIGSVSVTSDNSAVYVTILCKDGSIPNSALINQVYEYISDDTKRPITDNVIVQAPSIVDYSINLSYTIGSKNSAETATIQAAVENAVATFIENSKELNTSVNPDTLKKYVLNAGAETCTVICPDEYISVASNEVAIIAEEPVINYTGLI